MSRSRIALALAILSMGALSWAHWPAAAASSDSFDTAKVRLYSNGEVVGEWDALGAGRLEGDTFVFRVRRGVSEVEVRIHGTFSYEARP